MKTRTLKIEEAGDPYRYGIIPKVRVSGKWLEAAGFPPGERHTLTVLCPALSKCGFAEHRPRRRLSTLQPCALTTP